MSEYADGFDDGKGEKFDELMEEIVSLREQLKDCSAAFDRQQKQLDRNAEQNAALRLDAERYAYLVGGCRFAETDACWGTKESLDAAIDAAMKEEGK
tara:strand:+ start:62 stop:352 length:291 start_codon:yes stop_codon:yes gene_type:complete